jgi:hypothetical protein
MASDTSNSSAGAQTAGNADAAQKEAEDYWGRLIKPDKSGTGLFDRLLKGIAEVIVSGCACRNPRQPDR